MVKPKLLLCFDAFGTLFRPRRPIAQQYADVARSLGLTSFRDDELERQLMSAIKAEASRNPNYGKATGLDATKWWTNVIHQTFTPFLGTGAAMPAELGPTLMHRFASSEGYEAEPGLVSSLRALKRPHAASAYSRVVLGVITNSDDRVPSVLSSLSLAVSPLRVGMSPQPEQLQQRHYDIDFHCMSYDAGVEKPDRRIFAAAEQLFNSIIKAQEGEEADVRQWIKVYVGDEYKKDVVGALNAGWKPILLDAHGANTNMPRLEDQSAASIDGLYTEGSVFRTDSICSLVRWMTGGK